MAEHGRIDAFELWCWRRLLRVPWAERRSNQSILKEINPEYLLEGLMLKWKLQYLTTWCKEPALWKRPWCWERLKAGGKGDDRGWDECMASQTQWTWVWVNFRRWWRTGKAGVLQSMGSQKVRGDWATEQKHKVYKDLLWGAELRVLHCQLSRLLRWLRIKTWVWRTNLNSDATCAVRTLYSFRETADLDTKWSVLKSHTRELIHNLWGGKGFSNIKGISSKRKGNRLGHIKFEKLYSSKDVTVQGEKRWSSHHQRFTYRKYKEGSQKEKNNPQG